MRDFSKKTLATLARKGITIYGTTILPDNTSSMPFASGERGYKINDNGCGRIWTFNEVINAAAS